MAELKPQKDKNIDQGGSGEFAVGAKNITSPRPSYWEEGDNVIYTGEGNTPTTTGVGGPSREQTTFDRNAPDRDRAYDLEDWDFPIYNKVIKPGAERVFNWLKETGQSIKEDRAFKEGAVSGYGPDSTEAWEHSMRNKEDERLRTGETEAPDSMQSFEHIIDKFDPYHPESVKNLQNLIGAKPDAIFGPRSREKLTEFMLKNQKTVTEEQYNLFDIGDDSRYGQHMKRKETREDFPDIPPDGFKRIYGPPPSEGIPEKREPEIDSRIEDAGY